MLASTSPSDILVLNIQMDVRRREYIFFDKREEESILQLTSLL